MDKAMTYLNEQILLLSELVAAQRKELEKLQARCMDQMARSVYDWVDHNALGAATTSFEQSGEARTPRDAARPRGLEDTRAPATALSPYDSRCALPNDVLIFD